MKKFTELWKGAGKVKNGWLLLVILILIAFFISCGKKEDSRVEKGELVRTEAEGNFPSAFSYGTKSCRSFLH